ncbi:orotate phosphoribosyltransferase [Marinoscillum luteum]|uniref:Orotate phosphoribosyltransferase n=1 Tax=Marinoscillum luteum TaxID=861051 RepID=A0ABW7N5M6_9BACT
MPVQQYDNQVAKEIAKALLNIEAIKISPKAPFTWASGWKSPIYCDNRLSLSYPETRSLVKNYLAKVIREKFPNAECIAGVATAGIPQGALVADALDLPFIYIRSTTKGHGMENQIEGVASKGTKVVLIEDLVSTGGSSLQAAEAVRTVGMEVLGMVAIFTYGFGISEENFKDHHVDLWYLSDYSTMIAAMLADGSIAPDQEATLQAWRSNPAQWNQ